ncbi:MAG: hypothetical protein A2W03_11655 [Candidatus Aminicenantes bacterium RBG_16_63_16]|nr:MAG: hypothetical protein A2W03_11655 [Candidatus Aminicenantes bacterium RBG_16_63_16]
MNAYQNRVCQHVYENGSYRMAWQSAPLEGNPSVRLGDIDNDGQNEIVASVYYYTRTAGKKPNQVAYYNSRIHVFEEGASYDGEPSWSTGELGELPSTLLRDSWVADVDRRFQGNELVLMRGSRLLVYRITHTEGAPAASFTSECLKIYRAALDSIDVGDADGVPGVEIVVEAEQKPWIWKSTEGGWVEYPAAPVPLDQCGDASVLNLTHVRVRDVDNCGQNEVISTGTNERLMVWKWQTGAYEFVAASPDLNGNMAYGLDCGNVDGDIGGRGEVALAVWGKKRQPSRITTLAYVDGSYVIVNDCELSVYRLEDLRVHDLTGDGRAEVLFNLDDNEFDGLIIMTLDGDLQTGILKEVYRAPCYPYTRPEIR